MNNTSLTSIAILKTNWDEYSKDYIDCFVPFITECLLDVESKVISLEEINQLVIDKFKLNLPYGPLKTILHRCYKANYLYKESGVYRINKSNLPEFRFKEKVSQVEKSHALVITKFIEYVQVNSGKSITEEEAEIAIYSFIHNSSIQLAYQLAENSGNSFVKENDSIEYLVGRYISSSQNNNDPIIENILRLLQGNMLANALYLPSLSHVKKKFSGTAIYLDTSIILFVVGYAGPNRAAPYTEIVSLLRKYGAKVKCFLQTYEEAIGILSACASRLKSKSLSHAYGATMEYFIENGKTTSDVELMIARFKTKLHELGISIEEPPNYRFVEINEKGFEDYLQSRIHYSNERALVHDVTCISAISRIRRGRKSYEIENCSAIFITSNSLLVKSTRHFFQQDQPTGTVSLCMTDYGLGNLLWLKNPIAAPELPRIQLISHVYAALQPSDSLWKKYLAEVAKLQQQGDISEEDYYLLRYTTTSKQTLMVITEGDEQVFAEGTVLEILEVAKETLRKDLADQLDSSTRELKLAKEKIINLENESHNIDNKLDLLAHKISNNICKVLKFIFLILLIIAALLIFPWKLPRLENAAINYASSILILLIFILTILNLYKGETINALMQKFETHLKQFILRVIKYLIK